MRSRPLIALFLALAIAVIFISNAANVQRASARPTDVLMLDPSIVNSVSGAACAPACDLTNPADLLAVAETDGDGDGHVEEADFAAVDLDGDQLVSGTGTLWVLAFVTNDENVGFDADEGIFAESGLSQVDCPLADEDCDSDGVMGDDAVIATLQGTGAVNLGSATATVTQVGIDVEIEYYVVEEGGGSISGTVVGAGDGPLGGCHMTAYPLSGGGDTHAYTGVAGQYSLRYLSAGTYAVRASCSGYISEYYDDVQALGDAEPVAVTDGEDTPGINFDLDESATPTPSPWSSAVIATVQLPSGSGPWGVAANPVSNRVYVTNGGTNSVSVIDGETNSLITTAGVGQYPVGVGVNPNTNRIFVANRDDNSVSVIDGLTNEVVTSISLPGQPFGVAANPATNLVYVDSFSGVWVIDGATNEVMTSIAMSDVYPGTVTVNPVTNRIYVGRVRGAGLAIVDGESNELFDSVPLAYELRFLAVNPSTNRVYAHANSGFPYFYSRLYVIDGNASELFATIPDISTGGVAANPTTNHVFFATWTSSEVASVLSGATNTVIGHVPVGASPAGVAANPVTSRIYVVNNDDDTVTVISDPLPAVGGIAEADMSESGAGLPSAALALAGLVVVGIAGAATARIVLRRRED